MKFNKVEFKHQTSLMLTNGYHPKAQRILAKAGGTPDSLDRGQTLFATWTAGEEAVNVLSAKKQEARQAEEWAYQAAGAEVGDLIETIYHYFNDNTAILAQLGLRQRQYGNPKGKAANGNGNAAATQPAASGSGQTSSTSAPAATAEASPPAKPAANGKNKRGHQTRTEIMAEWQMVCANVQKLDQSALDLIAHQGWTPARCAEAAALVEALIQADITQQEAISAYHSQVDQARQDRQALYDWYWPIAKLARRAIRKLPPEQRTQYQTLLGL